MTEKTNDIVGWIRNKELVLPEFQREFTWNRTQARNLMDSLLRGYPTGSFLFWRTSEPPALKNLPDFKPDGRVNVLLDGQQRLTVLYLFLEDAVPPYYRDEDFDSKQDCRELYYNLMTRDLGYYRDIEMRNNPRWVRVVDCFKPDRIALGAIAEGIAEDSEERFSIYTVLHQNLTDLQNIKEIEHTIMQVRPDGRLRDALEVFDRVNSGGTPLTDADIALAHMCSAWQETRRVFKEKIDELRQEGFRFNLTFLVRSMNAVINGRAEYQLLHDAEEHQLVTGWRSLDRILDYLVNFLRDRAYVYSTSDLNSVNVLIPIIGYLSQNGLKFENSSVRRKMLYWMYAALFQRRYSGSVDQKVERDLTAITSDEGVDGLLAVLREDEGDSTVTPQNLYCRGVGHPYYPMSCFLIRARGGVDWANGLDLGSPHGDSYSVQRHHIFPASLLREAGYDTGSNLHDKQRVNEIANRVPLTQSSNMEIFTSPPEEYLPTVEQSEPGTLEKFMIPQDEALWRIENYPEFLAARRELIAEEINRFMKDLLDEVSQEDVRRGPDIAELIAVGENERVEFKSGIRWNNRTQQVDRNMENGVLKTIAAFLNSDGGTLLIGVSDDGRAVGLGLEGLPNRDKQQLHLVNLMRQRFGAQFPRFVKLSVEHVDGAEVLRVDCQPSPIPVFMTYENQQRFYVRSGPSSTELPVGDATEYILREFHADGAGVGG